MVTWIQTDDAIAGFGYRAHKCCQRCCDAVYRYDPIGRDVPPPHIVHPLPYKLPIMIILYGVGIQPLFGPFYHSVYHKGCCREFKFCTPQADDAAACYRCGSKRLLDGAHTDPVYSCIKSVHIDIPRREEKDQTSNIASISTGTSIGSWLTATAVRACRPDSPKMSYRSCDAALMTIC